MKIKSIRLISKELLLYLKKQQPIGFSIRRIGLGSNWGPNQANEEQIWLLLSLSLRLSVLLFYVQCTKNGNILTTRRFDLIVKSKISIENDRPQKEKPRKLARRALV